MFNCDSSTNSTFGGSSCSPTSTNNNYYIYYINKFPKEDFVLHTNFVERFASKKLLYERRELRTFYSKKDIRRNRLIGKREKRIGLKIKRRGHENLGPKNIC